MLTIAQITDLHIATAAPRLGNAERLRTVLAAIAALRPRPAAIFASGDLTETGTPEEYAALRDILKGAPSPVYVGMGNHDLRAPLLAAFPAPLTGVDDHGFVQYAVDVGDLRVVMCDTVEEGRAEGAFCEARAEWLARTLDAAPRRPTVVIVHHPPIPCGIQWMDPTFEAAGAGRLAVALRGRTHVVGVLSGHVHRAFHGPFAGHTVTVSAASALQLTLDLTPIDRRVPDGREILRGEPPGFALLAWDGGRLTTHHCVAGTFPNPVTYDTPFEAVRRT
ncbi:MAG: metallophosphoesterase [Caulobacteraceae bacterium]|jgi:Icc protein|nr:metallophosphoesterase [Caulobacteraceae bacterium]